MKISHLSIAVLSCCLFGCQDGSLFNFLTNDANTTQAAETVAINTESIYKPNDFQLNSLGKDIYNGVFTGNGLLGTMTYLSSTSENVLRVDVGRNDLYDHRMKNADRNDYANANYILFMNNRLALGRFELDFGTKILSSKGAIKLYDGHAIATVETKDGIYTLRTRTLSNEDKVVIEILAPQENLPEVKVKWVTETSNSARQRSGQKFSTTDSNPDIKYAIAENKINPVVAKNNALITTVSMLAGGSYGIGYTQRKNQDNSQIIVATTHYSREQTSDVTENVIDTDLQNFNFNELNTKIALHEKYWHDFYQKSSYSIPHPKLQAFYDMQSYKFGSLARENGPAIDLQGPWVTNNTPWPGYWHNLNSQLTYSPLYTANRLDIAKTLINLIDRNKQNLINNVPVQYRNDSAGLGRSSGSDLISAILLTPENKDNLSAKNPQTELGNLTWLLFYYHQHYRYSMDTEIGNNLFDLLKRSVQYQMHLLKKNSNNKYEFAVKTYSPEYPNAYDYNTNYDLSILKWGLKTLISLDSELNKNDPSLTKWKDVDANLIDYPKDSTGYKISSNISMTQSHRHYSHLMMIYPFYLVNSDQKDSKAIIENSIATWQQRTAQLQGYSFTGHASMQAMMGQGDKALKALENLNNSFIQPNTLYKETGPVIETPLSAMASLQELSLQYWDGVVRVFPAIPSSWADVSFNNFRTDGAFLITGVREGGMNKKVIIKSEKGGTIKIKPNLGSKVFSKDILLNPPVNEVYTIQMNAGQVIELQNGG